MKTDTILLDHGSGGKLSHRLITDLVLPIFDNAILSPLHDGAVLDIDGKRLAFSTDTFVVDPIFFPGGNIGDLAVNGTVNDLAMCGAVPLYLSVGLIIEEGFSRKDLEKILHDMNKAAEKAGVKVVTGDTKVVPKGVLDKIFINTSGIGKIPDKVDISSRNACPGDRIILSGTIGDHGVAVLTQREGMTFDAPIKSDTAPLSHMVEKMVSVCPDIHVLRDPTRGEGKLIAFVDPRHAEKVLAAIKEDEFGNDACIIGEVISDHPGRVIMKTRIGGIRIVDMLTGDQLPRIC